MKAIVRSEVMHDLLDYLSHVVSDIVALRVYTVYLEHLMVEFLPIYVMRERRKKRVKHCLISNRRYRNEPKYVYLNMFIWR